MPLPLISRRRTASLLLLTALLPACGGGGGVSVSGGSTGGTTGGSTGGSTAAAAGRYDGTSSDGRSLLGLVLQDGSYWTWYSAAGNSAVPGGFVQGSGTVNGNGFTSVNGKDFNLEGSGILSLSLAATYASQVSFNGTLTYTAGSKTFNSQYNSDYTTSPSLTTLAGTYSGLGSSILSSATYANQATTVTVTSAGQISGVDSNNCRFSGTVAPASGANLYTLQISFAGGSCALGTTTLSGIAVYTATSKQLRAAATDSGRSVGSMFVGTKP